MSRAAAVLVIVWLKVGRTDALAACVRVWKWGGVVAVLLMLSLVLLGEGAPTADVRGTVTTDFGGLDIAFALVLQPDGKLVAAGQFEDPRTFTVRFALVRYLPDGRLDPTFGIGGRVTSDFEGGRAEALVLQPDGKLVAAGFLRNGGTQDFVLVRYLPDGHLDPSFGVGGMVTTDFGNDDRASSLVLQPDGKLVAAGDSNAGVSGDFTVVRYLPDGRLDPSFGVGGAVTTDFGGSDLARALVLQPDGKLVAAGEGGPGADFVLARYLPDGRLDATFGVGGKVTTDFGSLDERALDLPCSPTASWWQREPFMPVSRSTLPWHAICLTAAWTPPSVSGAKSLLISGGARVAQPSSCSPMASWSRQERLQATFCWCAICRMGIWIPPSASGAKSLLISGGARVAQPSSCSPMASWSRRDLPMPLARAILPWRAICPTGAWIPPSAQGSR